MKAIIYNNFGGNEVLKQAELETPTPKEGELLIRIQAAGINPVDWKIREGMLKDRITHKFPIIPGWDFSGIIEKQGYSSRRFEVGDEVFGYARRPVIQHGTYAEYIVLPESYVSFKPRNISFEEAASVPLAALTAFQSIIISAKLEKKNKILIIGASGGVGSFAVQLARQYGAKVFTVASGRNREYLERIGSHEFFDYTESDFSEKLLEKEPKGMDIVFDCVGGEAQKKGYKCVKNGGQFVSILSFEDETTLKERNVKTSYVFVEPNSNQLKIIRKLIEEDKVMTNVDKVYKWNDVGKAHDMISSFHTRGKLVLSIPWR